MEELVNIITQNGIGVVCVGFMIYFISTTLKDNNKLVRREASTALSRMGEPAVEPLIETPSFRYCPML